MLIAVPQNRLVWLRASTVGTFRIRIAAALTPLPRRVINAVIRLGMNHRPRTLHLSWCTRLRPLAQRHVLLGIKRLHILRTAARRIAGATLIALPTGVLPWLGALLQLMRLDLCPILRRVSGIDNHQVPAFTPLSTSVCAP